MRFTIITLQHSDDLHKPRLAPSLSLNRVWEIIEGARKCGLVKIKALFHSSQKPTRKLAARTFIQSQYLKALATSLRVGFCDEWKRGLCFPARLHAEHLVDYKQVLYKDARMSICWLLLLT